MADAKREYRAVYTVLRVDPDFLPLSKDAKLYWHTAKLELPVSGIGICLTFTIAGLASLTPDEAKAAERELTEAGWIQREGAVLWLKNGLRHTPNLSPNDAKHRKYVASLLADLPRDSGIVRAFREHYADWFVVRPERTPEEEGASEGADEGASEGPPEGHPEEVGSKVEGRSKKDQPHTPTPTAGAREASPLNDPAIDAGMAEAERLLFERLGTTYREPLTDFLRRVTEREPAARYPWVQRMHGLTDPERKAHFTLEELGEALSDVWANARPIENANFLRACCESIRRARLRREEEDRENIAREGRTVAAVARAASHERESTRVAADRSQLAEAQQLVSKIRNMAVTNSAQGGTSRYIRLQDIAEQLGGDVAAAYQIAGGQDRFLNTKGDMLGILHRDFLTALESARRTNTRAGAA